MTLSFQVTNLAGKGKKAAGSFLLSLLMLGVLLSVGAGRVSAACTAVPGSNVINWTDSTGNWSLASNWSLDCTPNNGGGITYAATITTGSVTLDTNATVDSLTLGSGASLGANAGTTLTTGSLSNAGSFAFDNGNTLTVTSLTTNTNFFNIGGATTANLTNVNNSSSFFTGNGGGGNNVLNVSGTFANGATFEMLGLGDQATLNALNNTGTVFVQSGTTLTVTQGIPTIAAGSSFTAVGTVNGFGNLTTVAGSLNLENGQTTNDTPTGGTLTVASGGNLTLSTSGTTLSVTGALNDSGSVTVGTGTTLNLSQGMTDLPAGGSLTVQGTLTGVTNLTSVEGSLALANGQTTTITPGGSPATLTLASGGTMYVSAASTLTVNGNLVNSGTFYTGYPNGGGSTVNVNGGLTNNGGFYMYYGGGDTLNVAGAFTNAANATFYMYPGAGSVANVQSLDNSGNVDIFSGNTLNLTGGGQGITDVKAGSTLTLGGTLNVINGGTPSNGLGNLTSVEGTLNLQNGQTTSTTPNGGTLTVASGGNLSLSTTGTTLSVTGALSDSGSVTVGTGTTLNLSQGMTDLPAGGSLTVQGTLTGVTNLTSVEGVLELANGQTTTITPGGSPATLTLASGSTMYVSAASTLTVNGNLVNSGTFYTGYPNGGGSTVNVNGGLTNNGGFYMYYGGGDTLNVAGAFTNAANATFYMYPGAGSVANVQSLDNSGNVDIFSGNTLNLTGGGQGITDVKAGSTLTLGGTLNVINGGTPSNGLGNLTSVEGTLNLQNGQTTSTTPNGGTLTVASGGNLSLSTTGTTLSVTGALSDSGSVTVGTGTTVTVSNGINLPGSMTVNSGGTVNGLELSDLPGTLLLFGTANNALANLTSVEGVLELANGQTTTITPGGSPATLTLASGGTMYVSAASTLTVNGNLVNSGTFYTGYPNGGGSTVNVNGGLTNNGGFYMYYGGGDTLNVAGAFTNAANATFYMYPGAGSVANVQSLDNSGNVDIFSGNTLNLTGGGQGITDVKAGSTLTLGGTLNVINGGTPSNGLGNLTSVEGTLNLQNGQTTSTTPNGGTLTVASGGNLSLSTTGTTLSVTGALSDSGSVTVGTGTTLTVSNGINLPGSMTVNSGGTVNGLELSDLPGTLLLFGTANNALANLTSVEGVLELANGQTTTITPGGSPATLTLASGSTMYVSAASTLTVNGNLVNSGTFYTGYPSGGGNTVNVNGGLTNNGGFYMYYGGGDTLNVAGALTNGANATFYMYPGAGSVANVQSLDNSGNVYLYNGNTVNLTGSGSSSNSGSNFTLGGGTLSSPSTSATFTNTGTVQTQSSPSTLAFGGTFTNAITGNLNLNVSGDKAQFATFGNGGAVKIATGALLGVGTGTFAAGGGFQQLAGGTFNELIAGTNSGSFGFMTVSGNVSLNGTIGVQLLNNFTPGVNQSFDILNYTGSLTGQWSNVSNNTFTADGRNWSLTEGSGEILLTAGQLQEIVADLAASGNWTTGGTFSCTPVTTPCVPNNGVTTYAVNIDLAGNTVTLDSSSTPNSVTIDTLSLQAGNLTIGSGATLNLAKQPNGITDIPLGAGLDVAGTFQVNGTTNALAKLGSVEGNLTLDNQTLSIGNALTVASGGLVNLVNGTNLSVSGNLGNSGTFFLGDGGTGSDVLTVTGTLTNNAGGTFDLIASGDTAKVNALSNAGAITINPGTTLNITGGGPGVTDVVAGSSLNVGGTFVVNGTTNALANLANVEGSLTLNSQTLSIGNALTVASGGFVNLTNGTNVSVSGNLANSGTFYLGDGGSGNDTLTVSGTLTNNAGATFALLSANDVATLNSFKNLGSATVGAGATLNLTQGITDIVAGSSLNVEGAINAGGSNALAGLTSVEGSLTLGGGQSLTVTPNGSPATLTVASGGFVNIVNGTGVTVSGNASNSGQFYLGDGGSGKDTLTVSGTLTNGSTGTFDLFASQDVANLQSLNNSGNVFIQNGTTVNLTGSGNSSNSGSNFVLGGGTLASTNTSANFTNSGTMGTQTSPSNLNFAGTFTNAIGGTLNLNVSGDKAQIGTLANGGTVNVASGALLGVGAGTFTAASGFQQLSNGTLNEMLGGITAGSFGVINVTGGANLAGALGIQLVSFNPTGDTFDIMNFSPGSLTGEFTNGTSFSAGGFNWTVEYNNAGGDILLSAAQIPSQVAATWSTVGGNWTNSSLWSCNPSFSPCMPNNANGTSFTANIDSPGNTLTLNTASTPSSITIDSLTLTAGTLNIASGATLNLVNQPNGITDIPLGAGLDVAGTFQVNGTTNALAKLGSVEGNLTLDNQTLSIGNALTVASGGLVNLVNGTNLSVSGNLGNSGTFFLGDGGTGSDVLTVTGTLTNNAGGTFDLIASGDTAKVNALSNAGAITINPGTTLNITGGGPGVTDVVAGSSLNVGGTFVVNGTTNALAQLASVEGNLTLNGQTLSVGNALTINSGGGTISTLNGTNLSVNGNLTNGGSLFIGNGGSGNDTLSVSGTLTNNAGATFDLLSANDVATLNSFKNLGSATVGAGATLNLTQGITDIVAGSSLNVEGTINAGGSNALAGLTSVEGSLTLGGGQSLTVTPNGSPATLTVASGGLVNIVNGTKVSVSGNASNGGSLFVGDGGAGGDVLTVNGTLTNNVNGSFEVLAPNDAANLNSLNNNGGAIFVQSGTSLNLMGANGSSNGGGITLGGGTFSSNDGGALFTNTGTVQTQSSPSTIAIAGTFANAIGGNLNLNVSGDKAQIGTLANGGTVNVASGALLGVGAGTFTAASGFQQLSNGTLNEMLGGTTAGSFGVINVTGGANLAGALGIQLVSFNPTGDTFDIMNFTPGMLTGEFTNGTSFSAGGFNWTVEYNNAGGDILLSAAQIPSQVAATWSTVGGNWTNSSLWSCNPSFSPCMPNNANGTSFTANIDSPGNTLTLNTASTPSSITIDSLTLTAGTLNIASGATLNLVNQPNGITDIPLGAGLDVAGTFQVNGTTNALAGLTKVEGTLTLEGQNTNVTPSGGTLTNTGTANLQQGTTLAVTGNLSNSGAINTGNGASDTGSNAFNLSGALTNSVGGSIQLFGVKDSLSAASVANSGGIVLGGSSQTLTDAGAFNNNGAVNMGSAFDTLSASSFSNTDVLNFTGGNDTVSVAGAFENAGAVNMVGLKDTLNAGSYSNTGNIGVGASESLKSTGDFTNGVGGSLDVTSGLVAVGGNFTTFNALSFTPGSTNGSVSVTEAFNNNKTGNVNMQGTGDQLTAGGLFTNAGSISLAATEILNAKGNYTQTGGATNVSGTLNAPTFTQNGGATTVAGGGLISTTNFDLAGGTVQGTGTIGGAVTMTGGMLVPGMSAQNPGLLTINGNFTQSGGIFDELISGTGNGLLQVNGGVSLDPNPGDNATLDISLLNGFTLAAGDTFDIMKYLPGLGLTGTFADAPTMGFVADGWNWNINYAFGGNEVVITSVSPSAAPTPEPGTMVLFGTGLLSLAWYVRRKKGVKGIEAI